MDCDCGYAEWPASPKHEQEKGKEGAGEAGRDGRRVVCAHPKRAARYGDANTEWSNTEGQSSTKTTIKGLMWMGSPPPPPRAVGVPTRSPRQ